MLSIRAVLALFVATLCINSSTAYSWAVSSNRRAARPVITMGKMAKFGLFSPAVLAAKEALGEKRLNKIRGQAITLHSQVMKP